MKKILSLVLVFSVLATLFSCDFVGIDIESEMSYAESTGWVEPSSEEFYDVYCELFAKKINTLMDKYDIEAKIKDESVSGSQRRKSNFYSNWMWRNVIN